MPAYCVWDIIEVTDAEKMAEYRRRIGPVVEQYGGRYLTVGGKFDVVEGDWKFVFPVIIEFPSLDQAHRWYDSQDYRELKQMRLAGSRGNAVFIEGL
jgi:uncharacterized protein (DUF1330 family)